MCICGSKNTKMKRILKNSVFAALILGLAACNNESIFDASGSFEAVETVISAEATGTLKSFQAEEGQSLEAGQQVGYVDTVQLYLKKKQLESQMEALAAKKPNIAVQLSALQEQLKTAEVEKKKDRFRSFLSVMGTTKDNR
jgi:HlyD family secretion protein